MTRSACGRRRCRRRCWRRAELRRRIFAVHRDANFLVVAVVAVLVVLVVWTEVSAVYLVAWGGPVLNFHSATL